MEKLPPSIDNDVEFLKKSLQDLEQFVFTMAHDLQSPVKKITNFSDVLISLYGNKGDKNGEVPLNALMKGASDLTNLAKQLIDFARAGQSDMAMETLAMNEIVNDALADLSDRIALKKAKINATIGAVNVKGNPILLYQLWMNLFGNSLLFSNGPVTIDVDCTQRQGDWLFSVRDSGIGFPEEESEKIFNSFYRLHPTSRYPGAGLGLTICRRIVERHGGKIWAQINNKAGAAFFFTIPKI